MSDWWIYITDNIGVAAAAVSGAMIAIERKLDLFGVFFLGMITALGGGVLRDVLLGSVPPRFFTNYLAIVIVTVMVAAVFIIAKYWNGWRLPAIKHRIDQVHNLFDAVGLSAFTVTGVQVAMTAGYADNPFLCVFMGMTTGIGGGVLRDMMSRHTPYVLQKRIYAVASIVGAILYWFMCYCNVPLAITQVSAMLLVIGIRMCATIFRWNLPKVPLSASEITNNIKSKKDTNQK
jgi:uncharacterized membrane protein YeiH